MTKLNVLSTYGLLAYGKFHPSLSGTGGTGNWSFSNTLTCWTLTSAVSPSKSRTSMYALHCSSLRTTSNRFCHVHISYIHLSVFNTPGISCISMLHTHTHTHTFNGSLPGTTRVSRYQKGKTSLDFTEARDSEWQRHQLGRVQVCTSLQIDNHASTPPLSFALPATQPTASKHWKQRQHDFQTFRAL